MPGTGAFRDWKGQDVALERLAFKPRGLLLKATVLCESCQILRSPHNRTLQSHSTRNWSRRCSLAQPTSLHFDIFLRLFFRIQFLHGSLNVPIEHIRSYKVMSNIPKMGQLPTPVLDFSLPVWPPRYAVSYDHRIELCRNSQSAAYDSAKSHALFFPCIDASTFCCCMENLMTMWLVWMAHEWLKCIQM